MSRHSDLNRESGGIFYFGGLIMPIYSNTDMCRAISEYVHHPKYREVLRLRFCDGLTYEEISEAVNFSPQHVKHICKTYKPILISHL